MCILPIVARQQLGKHVPSATNTCNVGRIILLLLCVFLDASSMRSVSLKEESVCLSVYPLIIARQRQGRHISHGNKELLEVSFPMRPVSYQREVGD
jgi:hypothetical protein